MHARRFAVLSSILGLTALSGCAVSTEEGATPEEGATSEGGEHTGTAVSALLPADPNWVSGLTADSLHMGSDTNGMTLYACRANVGSSVQTGLTRADWGC